MESVPWKAEIDFTAELAKEVLRPQFPDLNIRDVTFLNEGWDSFAFLANGEWVFLFPKRRERERWLLASMRLLAELHDEVPLPVPRPVHWGSPCELFPFHYGGYRFLPGSCADLVKMPGEQRDENARRLGEFLAALHRFPPDRARELGIEESTGDHAEALLDEVHRLADRIPPRLPRSLKDRCVPFLDGSVERPPAPVGSCCLTNGDLQAEHILLDEDGAVCGIIDFGDAALAEPAGDYVGLCAWQGWDFARAALAASGSNADETTEKRIRFMARCLALISLGWADPREPERMTVYRRFLSNAFDC